MTAVAPTFDEIKGHVHAVRRALEKARRGEEARVVGIHAPGRWTEGPEKRDGAETYWIEQCDSPLQIRLALGELRSDVTTTVLLTSLTDADLEEDIRLRLAKRRLLPIDSWRNVQSEFEARSIDPRVTCHGWMAERLLKWVPPGGYPRTPSGFLDAETVWRILLDRELGLTVGQPDLTALLRWSIEPANVDRFRGLPEAFQRAVIDWIGQAAGPAAEAVLECLLASQHADPVPIGLAMNVVFNPQAAGRLDKAAGRMEERYLGGMTPDESLVQRWHASAVEVVTLQLNAFPKLRRAQLDRADEILRDVQADGYAWLSDTSPLGFHQRLARYGTSLAEALQARPTRVGEHLTEAKRSITDHQHARREARCIERVEMAMRLMRWLERADQGGEPTHTSFGDAAKWHLAEGAFLDWARNTLRTGDPVRELSDAYARLGTAVTDARERQAHRFAELLRDWTIAGSTGDDVIPVERVLDEIVVSLAAESPVLVLVFDGMSAAVYRELLADVVRRSEWCLLREANRHATRPAVAAIPSVTQVSRTSLLCGRLCQGGANDEQRGFAEHPGMLAHCRKGSPPVLFSKPSLHKWDDASLAANVRKQIASPQRRIVGVIINAVDDSLLKGEQLDTRWTCDEIKILPTLLHEARLARRLVVIVSDHGHVLDHQTEGRLYEEAGERWRHDDGKPRSDEIQIRGSRVVIPEDHQLIAPWSEKVRYGIKKNGYHGGLAPQEMVIPIAVLSPGETCPDGWNEAQNEVPDWWEEPVVEALPPEAPVLREERKPKKPGFLFDLEGPEQEEAQTLEGAELAAAEKSPWIAAFLASPVLAEQKQLAGRSVPSDQQIADLLGALDVRGGKMTDSALARRLALPLIRLPGFLAVMQRVLNVEGYAVLTRDEASNTVELNRDLLCRQFGLT